MAGVITKDGIVSILAALSHNGTESIETRFVMDLNGISPYACIKEIRFIGSYNDYVVSYGTNYGVTDEIRRNPDSISANLGVFAKRTVEFIVPNTVMATSCHGNLIINMKELQIEMTYQMKRRGLEQAEVDYIGRKYPRIKVLAKSVLRDTIQFLQPQGDFEVIVEKDVTHSWKQTRDSGGELQTTCDYLCLHTDNRVKEIFEIAKKYMIGALVEADKEDGVTTQIVDWCLFIQKRAEKNRTVMSVRFDTEITERGKVTVDVGDIIDQLF